MEEHEQKVLCRAWKFLVNNVSDVDGVIDCLFSQEVLTPNSRRRIMQGYNVQSDRMREALDEVMRTPDGLNILRQALLENGENGAAARLEPKAHQEMAGKQFVRLLHEDTTREILIDVLEAASGHVVSADVAQQLSSAISELTSKAKSALHVSCDHSGYQPPRRKEGFVITAEQIEVFQNLNFTVFDVLDW
ncbi:hypothetical protein BaRGS_00031893 [Batillaria attramentaria]|uniref:CARD domain-containing protein n=1 Tax=Batillaria attramentaria TaxID=370345 RepID=A0ABD0JQ88_9CAEN